MLVSFCILFFILFFLFFFFFFNDTATTEIYTLSLHDALPIFQRISLGHDGSIHGGRRDLRRTGRSEEHTSELQSRLHLVCRLLLEKKKKKIQTKYKQQHINLINDYHTNSSNNTYRS